MSVILYVVDAFTRRAYGGNPAAVCLLEHPADESWMKHVAREMNLAETAFLHPIVGGYSLRWLTPTVELQLCGHATLAAAFVLWETGVLAAEASAHFNTLSGWLTCQRAGPFVAMDFPSVPTHSCPVPQGLVDALGCPVIEAETNGMDLLVRVKDEATVRALKPQIAVLAVLPVRGIIVTAQSSHAEYDFVSRFFAPGIGINEDAVTGSAHCALGPYWQKRLGKDDLVGYQASERGGTVFVGMRGLRIELRGQAVMSSRVEMFH